MSSIFSMFFPRSVHFPSEKELFDCLNNHSYPQNSDLKFLQPSTIVKRKLAKTFANQKMPQAKMVGKVMFLVKRPFTESPIAAETKLSQDVLRAMLIIQALRDCRKNLFF